MTNLRPQALSTDSQHLVGAQSVPAEVIVLPQFRGVKDYFGDVRRWGKKNNQENICFLQEATFEVYL